MQKIKAVGATPAPARKRSTTAGATPAAAKGASPASRKAKLVASVPSTPTQKVKHKLVRDSFTIPKSEYSVLEGLKVRAANLKRPVKKGELLRAGVGALHAMADRAFLSALNAVPSLKTGRPKAAEPQAQAPKGSGAA